MKGMLKHHMTEDHPRYSLKNPCLRLWTGTEHYNSACNLYTLSLQVQSIRSVGKLMKLLFNVDGNDHSKCNDLYFVIPRLAQNTEDVCPKLSAH